MYSTRRDSVVVCEREPRGEWWYGWADLALGVARRRSMRVLAGGTESVQKARLRLCRRCGYDLSATRHGMLSRVQQFKCTHRPWRRVVSSIDHPRGRSLAAY